MTTKRPCCHHDHEPETLDCLTNHLRNNARKITGPRQAVLEVLRQHPHPMTNKEVFTALPNRDCDLATIYRSMHLLQKMGLVKRFDFGDGSARFELLTPGKDEHHHHLICTECADILEIEECSAAELESQIARRSGFKAVTHKLEFFGICPQCQRK